MSERDPMPASSYLDENEELSAAIEEKIQAALKRGVDLRNLTPDDPEHYAAVMKEVGLTSEEHRFMAERGLRQLVRVVLGRKAIETLYANNLKIARSDLITCLVAYYEAVDEGSVEAVPYSA